MTSQESPEKKRKTQGAQQFDLVVLGGGSGGLGAARRAAQYVPYTHTHINTEKKEDGIFFQGVVVVVVVALFFFTLSIVSGVFFFDENRCAL